MKKNLILFCLLFLTISLVVNSQTIPKSDSNSFSEEATYLKEDLNKFLRNKFIYPHEGFVNKIEGDVIFSIEIKKDGSSTGPILISSDDKVLSQNAAKVLNLIENKWNPAKINDVPIDKKYFIVVRYRLYINTEPTDYNREALDLIRKQKYEKAIKTYDKAIKENQYSYELLISRSQLKAKIGDYAGSKQDYEAANKLAAEILTVFGVIGKTVTTRTVISSNISSFPR